MLVFCSEFYVGSYIQRQKIMTDIEKQADTRWALSPVSGRYVLRTSTTYKRLVKGGFVHDPEVAEQLARPATGTKPKYKGPNVVLRGETDQIRDMVAAAVAAEMANEPQHRRKRCT